MCQHILVAYEKHGNRYLAAADDQQLGRSALKLLTERERNGWYPQPDRSDEDQQVAAAMTDEQIAALPAHLRAQATTARTQALRQRRQNAQQRRWHEAMLACVRDQDPSAAWMLLQQRADYEYEAVALEQLES